MARVSRKAILQVSFIVLGITLLHYLGLLSPLERLWQNSLLFVGSQTSDTTSSLVFWHGWDEKGELTRKIEELEERLQINESSLARLNALEKENQELKNALLWRELQNENYLIGELAGRPFNLPATFAVINRGESDGVKPGFPIIINEDILIGKIVEVKEDASFVRLITDNNSIFSVRLSDGVEAIGKVEGKLGLSLQLDTVPSTEELNEGDIIVTSGVDPLVPEGLVIGSLEEISNIQGEFFQSASVNISYDPKEISIVSIIITE